MKRTGAAAAIIFAIGLLAAGSVYALTSEEAKKRVENRASERGLIASETSAAVQTLQRLVDQGVPVEHALRVVSAAIDDGIRGEDLAAIARSMEKDMKAGMTAEKATERALSTVRERSQAREREVVRERIRQDTGRGPGTGSEAGRQGMERIPGGTPMPSMPDTPGPGR